MTHYIAILKAREGEWHALFPDIPDCEVRGASLDQVKFAAANELTQRVQTTGSSPPQPRDLSEIERVLRAITALDKATRELFEVS